MADCNYHYSAFGLNIGSEIELAGFTERATEAKDNVTIRFRTILSSDVDRLLGNARTYKTPGCDVRVSERAMFFDYPKSASILVSDGTDVVLDLKPGSHANDLTPYLTGYILAVLLLQRGYLVLHASVVLLNGRAVGFLGSKGFGKSTLAADLTVRGYSLVSDDHLPIIFRENMVVTLPGSSQMKLFADSLAGVGVNSAGLAPVHPLAAKYMLPANSTLTDEAIPLSAVYLLSNDEDLGIESLQPSLAFIEAVRHTHVNFYLEDANVRERHFADCNQLIQKVPFFLLKRPHDFAKMSLVTEMVEEHFAGLTP